MSRLHRASVMALVLGAAASGCYEMAWYYPAPGQGSMVSNGERLGIAHRLSEDNLGAQSFIVLCVREAYTAHASPSHQRTIVQVTANLVNQASAPAKLDVKKTHIEVAGRVYAPTWVYRSGGLDKRTLASARDEVAPNTHARFDMFFDLGAYPIRISGMTVAPISGGIPLMALRDFHVTWVAQWAGRELSGKIRFYRDYTGGVGGGWVAAPGPFWGYGWWTWGYPWPTGGVIIRPHYPWRASKPPMHRGGAQVPKVKAPSIAPPKGTL